MGRSTVGAICIAMVLVVSAFWAQSAGATGTTAFKCKKGSGTAFTEAHCKTSGAGEYGLTEIPASTPMSIALTNLLTGTERQTIKLKSMQAGIATEIQAKVLEGTGTLENRLTEGGEHYAHIVGTLTLKEVTVATPAGKGCTVKGGEFKTNEVTFTTEKQEDFLKLVPVGALIATYTIEGCTIGALNHAYELKGAVKGVPSGATTNFTHASTTEQKTLLSAGQTTGLDASLTLSNEGTPIALSTELPPKTAGTTGFTCGPITQPNSTPGFTKSHCKASDAVESNAAYLHTEIPTGSSTEVIVSNKNTTSGTEASAPLALRATIAGVDTEIQATGVSGTGTMENSKDGTTGEHRITGSGTVTLTGVTVTRPEGKGCKVKTGEAKTKELKATTAEQGDAVKFEPASGSVLASFEVEGCSTEALNGLYEVKGSIKGTPDGATISFTEEGSTIQNTMTMRSVPAGLEGTVTVAGRVKSSGSNYTDISPTTVNT